DVPMDGGQIQHQFGESGHSLTTNALLRAAKHVGLKAGLVTTSLDDLGATPLPAIARRTDGRHVVLAKVQGEKVLVQDPLEKRPNLLMKEEFVATWSGSLLLCTKRAGLRIEDRSFDITWFIPAVLKYRRRSSSSSLRC
ncbi:MAG TPA: cysteine peptidase family C39 domain-containing protein, partial [Nitrospira sp.]|nr:cysteine peptidase family C39 domain-containing protein [Nitrospira sp.]